MSLVELLSTNLNKEDCVIALEELNVYGNSNSYSLDRLRPMIGQINN